MEKQSLSSVEKALIILEQLGKPPYAYTVAELSRETGLNRTSIYRMLSSLEEHDAIMLDNSIRKYKIGSNMYHLGMTYLNNFNYKARMQDLLSEISSITNESVGIAAMDGEKIICLFESEVSLPMKYNDIPGRYYSVNRGAYGKCIMAFQAPAYIEHYLDTHTFDKALPNILTTKEELLNEYEKIRQQGYAVAIDELGVGVIGVGIPLFDRYGKVKASCGGAFFREDGWKEKLDNLLEVLLRYQKELENNLPVNCNKFYTD